MLLAAGTVPTFFVEVALLLVCGASIAYLGYRLKLVPIVGFLLTGVVIGPHALGLVANQELVDATAQVGVILLLFTIGIEFSLEKLAKIKTLIFGGGGLQVGLTTAVTVGLLALFGVPWQAGLFTGFLVALSSTAIVLKLLGSRGETNTEPGQVSLGILIFQDLAIIVMVLLVPMLAGTGGSATEILWALTKAGLIIVAALVGARRLLPPLLERVARTCSQELFLLTLIALCFGMALLASLAGVSLELGAFLAGLIVSESRFSEHAFGEIMPLQILFAATFFVSVGMLLDLGFMFANLPLVLGVVALVLLVKLLTTGVSVKLLGYGLPTTVGAAFMLAQVGEFSFVLERAGRSVELFPAGMAEVGSQTFIAATVLLMVLTPPLSQFGTRLARRLGPMEKDADGPMMAENMDAEEMAEMEAHEAERAEAEPHLDRENHVIIAGFGRAARRFAGVLQASQIKPIIITLSPPHAREAENAGFAVIRGDAARSVALEHAGIRRAKLLVIPDDDGEFAHRVASVARTQNPTIRIIARARFQEAAQALVHAGTDHVITEEYETVTQLFGEVLRDYEVKPEEVEHCLGLVRTSHYEVLRNPEAASALAPLGPHLTGALDVRTVTLREGAEIVGQKLEALDFEAKGLHIKAIRRGQSLVTMPPPYLVLRVDDEVTFKGSADAFAQCAELFRAPATDVTQTYPPAAEPPPERADQVHVYGANWCPLTGGFRAYLKRHEVPFDYHNIEEDAAAEAAVRAMNDGKLKFPMVVVGDHEMKNPPIDELEAALRKSGLLVEA